MAIIWNIPETENDIESSLKEDHWVFLYFSRTACGVCQSLKPKTAELLENYPQIKAWYINLDEFPALSGRFEIFTIPGMLLFIDGKESLREARTISMDLIEKQINRMDRLYRN